MSILATRSIGGIHIHISIVICHDTIIALYKKINILRNNNDDDDNAHNNNNNLLNLVFTDTTNNNKRW